MRQGYFLQRFTSRTKNAWDGAAFTLVVDFGRFCNPVPTRWYPFPTMERLYQRAIRETRTALREWINPWLPLPECSVADGMDTAMLYHPNRHEIWVHREIDYWFNLVDGFFRVLRGALERNEPQYKAKVDWETIQKKLQSLSHRLRERYAGVEGSGFPLSTLWPAFEGELFNALHSCQQQNDAKAMSVSYQALQDLYTILKERAHVLFIHELIHSWTKRVPHQAQKHTMDCLPSGQRDELPITVEDPCTPRSSQSMFEESMTEWIAQQIYRGTCDHIWRSGRFSSAYPAWIIEVMVQALNHEWEWLAEEHPSLKAQNIWRAEELLYWMLFKDPRKMIWLGEVLTSLTAEKDALNKVSQACVSFARSSRRDVSQMNKALQDLANLFAPFLPSGQIQVPPTFVPNDDDTCDTSS